MILREVVSTVAVCAFFICNTLMVEKETGIAKCIEAVKNQLI